MFYTCHPVLSPRLSRSHSRTAPLDFTTSVRPTKGSNAFVAALSEVLHWKALWWVRGGQARGK